MEWKTKVQLVDIDTGEILYQKDLINYVLINKEKKTDYGIKEINYVKLYRRVYRSIFD